MSAHQPMILGISMTYNNNNSLLDSGLRGSGFQPWLWSLCCSLRQDPLFPWFLSPPRCIINAGVLNLVMDWQPTQGSL